jgi:predicted GIY-YIG superfamily endonuclease
MNNVVYEIQIGPYRQVGSTNNLERRMSEHLNSLEMKKHANRFMQNAHSKYKSFSYKILRSFETREEAYSYEQELLNQYFRSPGYLMMSNHATGHMSGEFHPNKKSEARERQSKRLALNNPMKDPAVQRKKAETKGKNLFFFRSQGSNCFLSRTKNFKQKPKPKAIAFLFFADFLSSYFSFIILSFLFLSFL